MVHDRPRDQLREKHHKNRKMQWIAVGNQPSVAIHQIGYLLKDKEGNPKGKNDVQQGVVRPEQSIHAGNEEIGVLEIPERGQIDRYTDA